MKQAGIKIEKPTYAELEKQVLELNRIKAERNMATDALRENEEYFRTGLKSLPGGLFAHDLDGHYLLVNDAAGKNTGYSREELMKMTVSDIDPGSAAREDRVRLWHQLAAGQSTTVVSTHIRKDGSPYPAEVHLNALTLDEKPIILAIAFDITERKHAEVEQATLQLQLAQAQKMESIGRLAGGVAHDFNNMLGVIIGRSELALKKVAADPSLTSDLQAILRVARHSADLTRQLLAFARRQTVSPKVLNLNETLGKMINMLQHLIGEDIHLSWQPGERLWPVKVDSSQVDQILANLCVNARDAICDVGRIAIETGNIILDTAYCSDHAGVVPGEYVLITFSDNGCGMEKEILGSIFEPFFTTKDVGKGTGLGLSMVYGTIKQNKGFIDVSSTPGKGTTFKIYLPRYRGVIDRRPVEDSLPRVVQGHETILLVEDEPAFLEMTAMMLKELGYVVLSTTKPTDAVRLAEENPDGIQLLMTDVVMPGMNGPDLADELSSRCPSLRCLFMSGYTAEVLSDHAGFDHERDFIRKPFSLNALTTKVRGVLDRSLT